MSKDIFLFEGLEKFGYKITTISVLGRVKDSVLQLKRLVDFCGDRVDYIVLKILYWGKPEDFIPYDKSKKRPVRVFFYLLAENIINTLHYTNTLQA